MFNKSISMTQFTSEAAESYFENKISGRSDYDASFLSTLRALLGSRIGEDFLRVRTSTYNVSNNELDRCSAEEFMDMAYISGVTDARNELRIIIFLNRANEEKCLKVVSDNYETMYPGWHRVEKVTQFFHKSFNVICYINPELKSTLIVTGSINLPKYHYLQCGTFAFLPWYFQDNVSELDMELIYSLREKTADKYEECLEKIAAQYDFETEFIKTSLKGFELKYEGIERDRVERDITRIIEQINKYNREISQRLSQKRDLETKLFGLDMRLSGCGDDSGNELMDYFLCNKKLTLLSVRDFDLYFAVRDYITYYDEDMAKKIIDNEDSFLYKPNGRSCNNIIPVADMKALMTAVFLDQKIKIKVCAAYTFQIGGNVAPMSSYGFGTKFNDYMPNPHIDRYSCIGNYGKIINEALMQNDYIGAIEQCIASCKSLNFADSAVMIEFMRQLYGLSDNKKNVRCFELPDGNVVGPKEAIQYLKEENENG